MCLQKYREREAVLAKMKFFDQRERQKWLSIMKKGLMSSEESEIDGDNEVVKVKTLAWKSDHVNRMIKLVDDRILDSRSALHGKETDEATVVRSFRPSKAQRISLLGF